MSFNRITRFFDGAGHEPQASPESFTGGPNVPLDGAAFEVPSHDELETYFQQAFAHDAAPLESEQLARHSDAVEQLLQETQATFFTAVPVQPPAVEARTTADDRPTAEPTVAPQFDLFGGAGTGAQTTSATPASVRPSPATPGVPAGTPFPGAPESLAPATTWHRGFVTFYDPSRHVYGEVLQIHPRTGAHPGTVIVVNARRQAIELEISEDAEWYVGRRRRKTLVGEHGAEIADRMLETYATEHGIAAS